MVWSVPGRKPGHTCAFGSRPLIITRTVFSYHHCMKLYYLSAVIFLVALSSCTGKKEPLTAVQSVNPAFKKNTAFEMNEDLTSPKFLALREKYRLDTIFHGEQDEFKRQLMLRNWIR